MVYSPGVIVTEVHKRAGLDEDQYTQVHIFTLMHVYNTKNGL